MRRVLVIEDELIVGIELEAHLSRLGYRVVGPVASYEDAIAAAEREPPDLVLADIRISGARNGLEAGEELVARHGAKLLVVTAYTDPVNHRRAERAGASAVLTKPFRAQELERLVREILEESS